MRRSAALLLGLAVLTGGCGGKDAASSATDVETRAAGPGVPAGFSVRVVKDQGFSIAFPKDWRSIDARAALSGELDEFKKANPQIAASVEGLARPNSPIKLLAVDPSSSVDFLTNVNVLVTPIPTGISFEEWSSAQVGEIRKVARVKGFTREETQLRPGRTLHLTYRASFNRAGGAFVALIDQYMVERDDSLYILTYTTTPSSHTRERKVFADSARSFRLTGQPR
jgi:hypothetical protein